MYNQTNPMAPVQQNYAPFVIPNMMAFSPELMEDMDGFAPSFERIKIPGGGVPQFEMPSDDPSNPNYEQKLEAVILYTHGSNAYWIEGEEYNDDTPPLCQAVDGKFGYGTPGGVCQSCALNQFKSASRGNGKACKNMRTLYILRNGDMMPYILSLPPTSIKAWREFFNKNFWYRGREVYSSLVEITLKRTSSNGFDYSVAVFRRVRDFEGEELAQITQYAQMFRQQAKDNVEQRKEMNKAAAVENVEIDTGAMQLPDNGDHFAFGRVINGDLAGIPA